MSNTQFIGTRKVKEIIEQENDLKKVILEDDSAEVYTSRQLESVLSNEKYTDGEVRAKKYEKAVKEIIEILLGENIVLADKDFILDLADTSIVENYNTAICKALSSTGAKHTQLIALKDVNKILTE